MFEAVCQGLFILGGGVWAVCRNLCGRRRARADREAARRLLKLRTGGDGVSIETYMLSMLPNEDIDRLLGG